MLNHSIILVKTSLSFSFLCGLPQGLFILLSLEEHFRVDPCSFLMAFSDDKCSKF
jgi:hypothetical protein